MSGFVKVIVIGLSVLGVLVVIAIGAGVWWWNSTGAEMVEAGRIAVEDGRRFGETTDQNGCLTTARTRVAADSGFAQTVRSGMYLRGCLEKAAASEGFCADVEAPATDRARQEWVVNRCERGAMQERSCILVESSRMEFCHPRVPRTGG